MNERELKKRNSDDEFDADETARRRDEVVRRMANTPMDDIVKLIDAVAPNPGPRGPYKNLNIGMTENL